MEHALSINVWEPGEGRRSRLDASSRRGGHGARPSPLRRRRPSPLGFTIVELIVGMSVTSIALLGVYAMFQRVLDVEADVTGRQERRAVANMVADHMDAALRRCANVPGIAALEAGPDESAGTYVLICTGIAGETGSDSAMGFERLRYEWGFSDPDRAGTLELRRLTYAGTRLITPLGGLDLQEADDEVLWQAALPVTIARHVSVSMQFRPVSDPEAEWRGRWSAAAGEFQVLLRVSMGGEAVRRLIVPAANAAAMEGGG